MEATKPQQKLLGFAEGEASHAERLWNLGLALRSKNADDSLRWIARLIFDQTQGGLGAWEIADCERLDLMTGHVWGPTCKRSKLFEILADGCAFGILKIEPVVIQGRRIGARYSIDWEGIRPILLGRPQSTPVDTQSTPVDTQSTPVDTQSTPVDGLPPRALSYSRGRAGAPAPGVVLLCNVVDDDITNRESDDRWRTAGALRVLGDLRADAAAIGQARIRAEELLAKLAPRPDRAKRSDQELALCMTLVAPAMLGAEKLDQAEQSAARQTDGRGHPVRNRLGYCRGILVNAVGARLACATREQSECVWGQLVDAVAPIVLESLAGAALRPPIQRQEPRPSEPPPDAEELRKRQAMMSALIDGLRHSRAGNPRPRGDRPSQGAAEVTARPDHHEGHEEHEEEKDYVSDDS